MKNDETIRQYRTKRIIKRSGYEFALFISIILILLPFFWAIVISLKTTTEINSGALSLPQQPAWSNYQKAASIIDFPVLVRNTLIVAVVAISISIFLTILGSFAIGRIKFGMGKLQKLFYTYFIIGQIIPVFVMLYPIYLMMNSIHAVDTLWGVIIPYIGWSAPMNTLILVGAFKTIPSEIEEAAVMDGCKTWQILFKVDVPIIRSAIVTVAIISFLSTWNEFAVSVIMLTSPQVQTISLAASKFKGMYSTDYGAMAAAVVMLSIPQIAAFAYFQKFIVSDTAAGASKG